MVTKVKMDEKDSHVMQVLQASYTSLVDFVSYLLQEPINPSNQSFLDKKQDEAIKVKTELEMFKSQLDKKYYPQDGHNYKTFDFNFFDETINYHSEDE